MPVHSSSAYQLETLDEVALSPACDAEIRGLLCAVFADGAATFSRTRAWHGSTPSFSVLGRIDGKLVGHIGLIQRVIRAGKTEVAIFGVQNFGILPAGRGTGLGSALMKAAIAEAQCRQLKFGVLFCIPELEKYYASLGWRKIDVAVTMIGPDSGRDEPIPGKNIAMVLELGSARFPSGDLHLLGADW